VALGLHSSQTGSSMFCITTLLAIEQESIHASGFDCLSMPCNLHDSTLSIKGWDSKIALPFALIIHKQLLCPISGRLLLSAWHWLAASSWGRSTSCPCFHSSLVGDTALSMLGISVTCNLHESMRVPSICGQKRRISLIASYGDRSGAAPTR
jgi:hypothetical protein